MTNITYNEVDRNILKVIKYHEKEIEKYKIRQIDLEERLEARIKESLILLESLGYTIPNDLENKYNKQKISLSIPRRDFKSILKDANKSIGVDTEISFEDILSDIEIDKAYKRVDEIYNELSHQTGLTKKDFIFIAVATALQTAKWVLLPEIGNSFNPEERKAHDDPEIKKEHKQTLEDMRDSHYPDNGDDNSYWKPRKEPYSNKSWIEILFTKAPYDVIKGSSSLGLDLCGNNHRVKTLGHDPILGWIFGTANFMTMTATLLDFRSYRIENGKWTDQLVLPTELLQETIDITRYDWHCLAAALVAQGAHLKSDLFTKMGIPIPIVSQINVEFASKIYREHYDALCFLKDAKTVGISMSLSIIINMIISFIHGLCYNESLDGNNRNLYEVRTRKILSISNTMASGSNLIYTYITKNPHKLDIGGLLVTISRLFTDTRFILKVSDEFIQNQLDSDLKTTLDELDNLATS